MGPQSSNWRMVCSGDERNRPAYGRTGHPFYNYRKRPHSFHYRLNVRTPVDSSAAPVESRPGVHAATNTIQPTANPIEIFTPPLSGESVTEVRREAITSYGIISCRYDPPPIPYRDCWQFLIAQRRDTIAYSVFIKAQIQPHDLDRYIGFMTLEEKMRLLQHPFQDIWRDFWIHNTGRLFHAEYDRCAAAFQINLPAIAQSRPTGLSESPWLFPKGRKCFGESDVQCAMREFEEETRIESRALLLIDGIPPIHEYYRGLDGRWYCTVHFVCFIGYCPIVPVMATPDTIRKHTITEEIGDLTWADIGEILTRMDSSRCKAAMEAHKYLVAHGPNVLDGLHATSASRFHPRPRRVPAYASTPHQTRTPGRRPNFGYTSRLNCHK